MSHIIVDLTADNTPACLSSEPLRATATTLVFKLRPLFAFFADDEVAQYCSMKIVRTENRGNSTEVLWVAVPLELDAKQKQLVVKFARNENDERIHRRLYGNASTRENVIPLVNVVGNYAIDSVYGSNQMRRARAKVMADYTDAFCKPRAHLCDVDIFIAAAERCIARCPELRHDEDWLQTRNMVMVGGQPRFFDFDCC